MIEFRWRSQFQNSRKGAMFTLAFLLLVSGLAVTLATHRMYQQAGWPAADAEVLDSRIVRTRSHFTIVCKVAFFLPTDRVEATRRIVESSLDDAPRDGYAPMMRLMRSDYMPGTVRPIWYDPNDPDIVHLLRPGTAWFWPPVIYLILATLLIAAVRFSGRLGSNDVHSTRAGRVFVAIVLGIFACVGVGMIVRMSVPTLLEWHAMQRWPSVPGVVEQSWIDSGNKGSTAVALVYRYEVGGETYFAERRKLFPVRTNFSSKRAELDSFPPGTLLTVFYDPRDPWNAILDRSFWWNGLLVLLPVPFAAIGIGGLLWCRREWRRRDARSNRRRGRGIVN